MTEKKLNETYYQPDNLWAGNKTIRELHKITSIPKKMLGIITKISTSTGLHTIP